jgi:DNA-binding IclR family transcriptional regulator
MKSTLNALNILENIAKEQPITVNELALKLDQPKTNVQRVLSTLNEAGWIRKAFGQTKGWVLSSKLFILANQSCALADITTFASPHLRKLHAKTQETVFVSYLEGSEMTVADVIQGGKGRLAVMAEAGDSYPLPISAPGNACLATLLDEEIKIKLGSLIDEEEMTALLKNIQKVRTLGYAVIRDKVSESVVTVGTCFQGVNGKAIGGIGVSVPVVRSTEAVIDNLGQELKEIAAVITLQLTALE